MTEWDEFLIDGSRRFDIADSRTRILSLYESDKDYRKQMTLLRERIDERQQLMYAHDRYSLLAIFQAMDAAGKDGTIRAVFSGVNPHGVDVHSFKRPSDEELDHNFMWRTTVAMPPRGHIGVFNRSYYEEVLVARVHPEVLARQHLPPSLVTEGIWDERYEDIRNFERYQTRNGTVIRKFFLHVSKGEQKRRFMSRLDEPEKNWKFSAADVVERRHWKDYQRAYQAAIRATATKESPWYVIPADNKWFTRLAVAAAIVATLAGLDLHYPDVDEAKREALAEARRELDGNDADKHEHAGDEQG